MPKLSSIYKCTEATARKHIEKAGMKVVDFRVPKTGEYWLDITGVVYIARIEDPVVGMVGPHYERLILEKRDA